MIGKIIGGVALVIQAGSAGGLLVLTIIAPSEGAQVAAGAVTTVMFTFVIDTLIDRARK